MANYVGLWTIVRREFKRTWMTINQVVWPPVITTALFLFIFGVGLGSKIKTLGGVPYLEYLMPGLVMMNVIASSYDEASSSLFQQRFMNSIQELLIAPLSEVELLAGYMIGSVLRGLAIGSLVLVIGGLLAHALPHDWLALFGFMLVAAVLFSSMGIIGGLLAKAFDNLAFVTTFVITPLTYVGGVFSSIALLPPVLQRIALFNPIQYIVDGFRYSYTGRVEVPMWLDVLVPCALAAIALAIAYEMTRRGVNLRT